MKLYTQADVLVAIEAIKANARNLQSEIHTCAVSTLDHVRAHGDYRGAIELLNALPNGQRVKGLAAWFRAMSSGAMQLKIDATSKLWTCTLKQGRVDADFKMAEAEATDYGTFTAETEPKSMTLAQFIKRCETIANDDEVLKDGKPKVEQEARVAASEVVAFLRKMQIAKAA